VPADPVGVDRLLIPPPRSRAHGAAAENHDLVPIRGQRLRDGLADAGGAPVTIASRVMAS
jgi:hypothetical protein